MIVLADDDDDLRGIYSQMLRLEGHEVREAANGVDALALIEKETPSLLILDVWMPILNGFEVLERLRGGPAGVTMKVVMLSNLGDSDSRLESFSIGVVDYWTKGLSLDELRVRVRSLLESESILPEHVQKV